MSFCDQYVDVDMQDAGTIEAPQGSFKETPRSKILGEPVADKDCCYYRFSRRGGLALRVLVPRKWARMWCDFGASAVILTELLVVPDTALAMLSSVVSVLLWHKHGQHLSVNLNWTAVSFLIAFPLQNAIRTAYKKRESALQALVEFRSLLVNLYQANILWDWPGADSWGGRRENGKPKTEPGGTGVKKGACNVPLNQHLHEQRVRDLTNRILDCLQDILMVPRLGHPRNEFACGRRERDQVMSSLGAGREMMLRLLGRMHHATEDLKAAGMPANEASRINQYNLHLTTAFEKLWVQKTYSTQIGLRALLRVMIQILPFYYGPFWLHIARGNTGELTQAGLVFAILFSCLITGLLIAMMNLEEQVENPFRNNNRDTIRLKDEMKLARDAIDAFSSEREKIWYERVMFDWEFVTDREDASFSDGCSSASSF